MNLKKENEDQREKVKGFEIKIVKLTAQINKQKLVWIEMDKENDKNVMNIMKNEFDDKFSQYKRITEKRLSKMKNEFN